MAIKVDHLSAWYGSKLAVADVSMEIYANAVTGLIGPSGSGESTFMRCLNRMHEVAPSARVQGAVLLEGADIYAPDADPTRDSLADFIGPADTGATPVPPTPASPASEAALIGNQSQDRLTHFVTATMISTW